jgi:hypothetical protein
MPAISSPSALQQRLPGKSTVNRIPWKSYCGLLQVSLLQRTSGVNFYDERPIGEGRQRGTKRTKGIENGMGKPKGRKNWAEKWKRGIKWVEKRKRGQIG